MKHLVAMLYNSVHHPIDWWLVACVLLLAASWLNVFRQLIRCIDHWAEEDRELNAWRKEQAARIRKDFAERKARLQADFNRICKP